MTTCTTAQRCDTDTRTSSKHPTGFRLSVDVLESANAFTILADLPGASKDTVDVEFDQGELSIRASAPDRIPGGAAVIADEYAVGDYERVFRLGDGIDTDAIHAALENGVLTVTLPKALGDSGRRIEIHEAN